MTLRTNLLVLIIALVMSCAYTTSARGDDGIGVAIVYDLSGSMQQTVRDRDGNNTPKHIIAKRALLAVVDRLQKYADTAKDKKLEVGLLVYTDGKVKEALPLRQFKAQVFRDWAESAPKPNGGTPIGDSLRVATNQLMASPSSHKHIVVITDGENTAGPDPAKVLPAIQKETQAKGAYVSVHFVAFDVAAKVFDPLKKLDVTVVSAADEQQLNAQLSYVLQEKILVEQE
jgi:hypothetical protein